MAKKPAPPVDDGTSDFDAGKTLRTSLDVLVEEKARAGRPKYVPTAEGRQLVIDLAFAGIPQDRIAKHLGISINTLTQHFAYELETAVDTMLADCVKFGLANKARAGDTTSAIFIAKTRLRWREQPTQMEVTGKDGGAIEVAEKQRLVDKVLGLLEAAQAAATSDEPGSTVKH